MDVLLDPVNLLALLTLTLLEIVLGIDNVIFIAIITDSLPPERRNFARRLGLGLALFGRVALVLGVSWLLSLEHPLFTVLEHDVTISGLILADLGRPPVVGDRVEHEGVVLEVAAVRGKGVQEARVVEAPEPE